MNATLIFIFSACWLVLSIYGANKREFGWAMLFNFFASTMFCIGVLSWVKS